MTAEEGQSSKSSATSSDGDECVIVPAITDPAEIAERFPKGHRELKPYLRMAPQPNR